MESDTGRGATPARQSEQRASWRRTGRPHFWHRPAPPQSGQGQAKRLGFRHRAEAVESPETQPATSTSTVPAWTRRSTRLSIQMASSRSRACSGSPRRCCVRLSRARTPALLCRPPGPRPARFGSPWHWPRGRAVGTRCAVRPVHLVLPGPGRSPQGRNQVLLDQVAGAPGGVRTVGQHVDHLGEDMKELPQNPARQAAAAQGDQGDDPITRRSPQVNWASERRSRACSEKGPCHDQETELNPDSQPAQDLASLPQGSISRCLRRPRVHDSAHSREGFDQRTTSFHYSDSRGSPGLGELELKITTTSPPDSSRTSPTA